MKKVIKAYSITTDNLKADVKIVRSEDFVINYDISIPSISPATSAILLSIKEELIKESKIGGEEIFDPSALEKLKEDFIAKARLLVGKKIPDISEDTKKILVALLIQDMLGLGHLEILLSDGDLEEIVINSSKENIWVYHKEYGWLKTSLTISSERQIHNYASIIARRVGRQITTLTPILNAHLVTGDRATATLFPVSSKGNTLVVRKFARKPWTVTDLIKNNTLNAEVASFFWLIVQYELNMIVAGGTSSGKTALLNTIMPFIQPNHRIISIEDTRELQLPDFMHWVPLTTREPNPEGKGEVSMLDLMIASLRMRPDRIVVGEIRRAEQAEVLFEAMHTGHSVYATLHADTVDQVIRRMTNPPINIPDVMLEALHVIAVQYRDRKKGIRRTYQVAELIPTGELGDKISLKPNVLYRCKPEGEIAAHDECVRVFDVLNMHTGMTSKELVSDLSDKMDVLNWMVKNDITEINDVGEVIGRYYSDTENICSLVKKNAPKSKVLEK